MTEVEIEIPDVSTMTDEEILDWAPLTKLENYQVYSVEERKAWYSKKTADEKRIMNERRTKHKLIMIRKRALLKEHALAQAQGKALAQALALGAKGATQ